MSKQYDNELKGALFKNDEKQDGDTSADYKGSATINGTDYFMDAWVNTAQSGRKYLSVRFKQKQKQGGQEPRQQSQQRRGNSDFDDAPF
jgi:hypothetical protein